MDFTDEAGALPKLGTLYKPAKDGDLAVTGLFGADVNGDGRPDLLTVFSGSVAVQLRNADGTLGDPVLSPGEVVRGELTSAKFADLDGDVHLDIVMAGGGSGN